MNEYRIPSEYYFRIHHVRPRFKGDIENVLIYMAEELTAIGEKEVDKFIQEANAAIYRYPGNAHRELKTINNWRTEISALFGFIEHTDTTDRPGRRAIELAQRQDLVESFKIWLYSFQYPGAHIKPKNVLEQIEAGIHFKPAQYILKLLRYANENGGNSIGMRIKLGGREDLIHLIKRIPTQFAVGYDISSVELDERKRYIEVKTTISSKPLHFNKVHLTKNEWNTANSTRDRYYVYRLQLSKTERTLFLLQDPVGLYKQDLIDMIPSNGADITFDPKKVGKYEELLTWKN